MPNHNTTQSAKPDQAVSIENLAHHAQLALLRQAQETGGAIKIAFRDRDTGVCYVGEVNPKDRTHDLHEIGDTARINDWLRQYGRSTLDVIPTYDYGFESETDTVFDADRQPPFINRNVPSAYWRERTAAPDGTRQGQGEVAAADGNAQ